MPPPQLLYGAFLVLLSLDKSILQIFVVIIELKLACAERERVKKTSGVRSPLGNTRSVRIPQLKQIFLESELFYKGVRLPSMM